VLRAENAFAASAGAAGHQVEATAAGVALGRHFGMRKNAKAARHTPPRDTRTFKASFWWRCCRVALWQQSTQRLPRSCPDPAA